MSPHRLVVGAMIVNDVARPTRVLACRRHRPDWLRGRYEFPGGKVENGERPEAALVREVAEELGVRVREIREFPSSQGVWPIDDAFELRLFLCTTAGTPRPGETHDEVRWAGVDEMRSLPWADPDLGPAWQLADQVVTQATRPAFRGAVDAGEGIRLRPVEAADALRLASLLADPAVVRHLGHGVLNLPQTRLRVAERVAAHAAGERLSYVVERDGEVVGQASLGLTEAPSIAGRTGLWQGELGYAVMPHAQGQGIGTRAARALVDLGFGELGLRRITAMVFGDAGASHGVVTRLGMREEGRFVSAVRGHDGEWLTDVAYALLREEWEATRGGLPLAAGQD